MRFYFNESLAIRKEASLIGPSKSEREKVFPDKLNSYDGVSKTL